MTPVDPARAPGLGTAFLSLFGSMATLVCCALPALLVSLGAGATLAGIVTTVPQLVWLSTWKKTVFAVAGLLLAGASIMTWRGRNAPCPADSELAKACKRWRQASIWILAFSATIYLTGFFFAFVAVRIFTG